MCEKDWQTEEGEFCEVCNLIGFQKARQSIRIFKIG
jgi:hypothetical protein